MNETALKLLLDKQEISEIIGPRYARAIDWLDGAMMKECFHADGFVDADFLKKIGITGLEYVDADGWIKANAHAWVDVVIKLLESSEHRFHYIFNIGVEVSSNRARAFCNAISGDRRRQDNGSLMDSFFGCRYFDTLERRDSIWKISERRVVLDFVQAFPTLGGPNSPLQIFDLMHGLTPKHPLYWRLKRDE